MFPADGGKRQANCMAFLSWYCWKSIGNNCVALNWQGLKIYSLVRAQHALQLWKDVFIIVEPETEIWIFFNLIWSGSEARLASLLRSLHGDTFLNSFLLA